MSWTTRMSSVVLVAFTFLAAGCAKPAPFKVKEETARSDAPAPFDPPNTYPGWASDAPQYARAVDELAPEPKAKAGDPLHYFTKEKVVMIRQPSGYTPEEVPRVAVWWTDNNGFHWHKAGYLGREQGFFALEIEEDGDYGIRFVGPGQEQAAEAPAYPERVYHVDTTLPKVEVTIAPEQTWYNVGQNVTISWQAGDYHLIDSPVDIAAMLDFTADESKPIEIQKGLAKEGSITYQIPPETLGHEIRFRVDALDRANNLGIVYSHALQIVSEPVEQPQARAPTPAPEVEAKLARAQNLAERPNGGFTKPAAPPPKSAPPANEVIDDDTIPRQGGALNVPYATAVARWAERSGAKDTARVQPEIADPAVPQVQSSSESNQAEGRQNTAIGEADPSTSESRDAVDAGPETTKLVLREGAKDDLTHGNRLMIPMPATVACDSVDPGWAFERPWRMLAQAMQTSAKTVWSLPQARFMELNPTLRCLFLAVQSTRPVGEPAPSDSRVVGLPADKAEPSP